MQKNDKIDIFENKPIASALAIMAVPTVIRQLFLNIPLLFVLNCIFGMTGIIWTQVIADCINVLISYVIYGHVIKELRR